MHFARLVAAALIALALPSGGARGAAGAGEMPKASDSEIGSIWDDWTFIPLAFYNPETSLGFGVAVIHTFDLTGGDAPQSSNVSVGVMHTLENQTITQVAPELRYRGFLGKTTVKYQRYPTRYFAPGSGVEDEGERYDEESFETEVQVGYDVLPGLGVGMLYRLRLNEVLSVKAGGVLDGTGDRGLAPFLASGVGPELLYDSRDAIRAPTRGMLHRLNVLFYGGAVGSDVTAAQMMLDLRGYVPLGGEHVLALQGLVQLTSGRLPFQLLPQLGGPDRMRGWFRGQLRDEDLMAVQAEWRFPLVGRLGGVVFASAGTAFSRVDTLGTDDLRADGGVGLRFALNRPQRVNLRVDLAYGSEFQFYVDVLEAF
ncbi:MAG: BamA/TamA family outer membrane protein [Deltaproteobacteria bacterium]|nr:BamA/TamA family outer membrane protein [Deltaproteobacteria bacterium]